MSNPDILRLRYSLLDWGTKNIKQYPWRYTGDLYSIFVSEYMLHRTQVKQVLPVYQTFMIRFPDLTSYANGNKETIMTILKPLGLNWRIKGMIHALDTLWDQYKTVPVDLEKLLDIKGVGQYIGGATICFSTNRPLTLIDTNTVRVVGRIFGLDLSGEARRKKAVIEAITLSCDTENPRDFYYAMIDLAHSVCRPLNPICNVCLLQEVPCIYSLT